MSAAQLTFVTPPLGLGGTDYDLRELDAPGLYKMTAFLDSAKRLFVVDPSRFVPDYSPVIAEAELDRIGVGPDADPAVLLVVIPGEAGMAVNLMAPILVNADTGAAAQVVLDGQDLPARHLLQPVGA